MLRPFLISRPRRATRPLDARPLRAARPTPRLPGIALAVALLTSTSCGSEATDTSRQPMVRDSAGITIVENVDPAATPAVWTLDATPRVEIGTMDGDAAYQLYRVQTGRVLADGRIAVLEQGGHRVRVYGPDGRWLADWGGQGGGPGEFEVPTLLGRWPGDSVAVWDGRPRRLTLFDTDGAFGRTLSLTGADDGAPMNLLGIFEGGTLLASRSGFGDGIPNGVIRPDMDLFVLSGEGQVLSELGTFPGERSAIVVGEASIEVFKDPFQPRLIAAPVGDRIVVAVTDRHRLEMRSRDGPLERLVDLGAGRRVFTDAARAAFVEREVAEAPEEGRAGARRRFEALPLPDTLPLIDALMTDDERVWARPFHEANGATPATWLVLDVDGRLTARVEVPAGMRVLDVGGDYLLGLVTDEMDVERVQMLELRRGG